MNYAIEPLEARIAPATFTITNANDAGAGSLRQAILDANATGGSDVIDITANAALLIVPASPLPAITERVTITASTGLFHTVDGSAAGAGTDGLVFTGAMHSGSSLTHLSVTKFGGRGVVLANAGDNIVTDIAISTNGSHGLEILSPNNDVTFIIPFDNGGDGIRVTGAGAVNNTLLGLQFTPLSAFRNTGLDIDLGGDGVTPNDPDDEDAGPNGLQNAPVLFDALVYSGVTIVRGELRSTPSSDFLLEFSTGTIESIQTLLVTTDSTGLASFSMPYLANMFQPVRATATSAGGEGATSEFSRRVVVGVGEPLVTFRGQTQARFIDVDGDAVTIKTTRGSFDVDQFTLVPEGKGARLEQLVLGPEFNRGSITVAVKKARGGDGFVEIGNILCGVNLDKLTIEGTLSNALIGSGQTAVALNKLTVQNLSNPVLAAGDNFEFRGAVREILVKGDVENTRLRFETSVRSFKIDGDLRGSGLVCQTHLGSMKVGGDLVDTQLFADTIGNFSVKGDVTASVETRVAVGALFIPLDQPRPAIGSFIVGGSVENLNLFAGAFFTPDASIGIIKVGGDWTASNAVAGVRPGPDADFGSEDDELNPEGDPAIIARIASITIGGEVRGNGNNIFGFVAEEIGSFRLGRTLLPLTEGKDAIELDDVGQVFAREV